MNPAFNDDLDDYINSRKDKGKLQRKMFWSIKKKQKNRAQEELKLEQDNSENNREEDNKGVRFSVLSIFRKRIPDEEVVAKQQAAQASKLAEKQAANATASQDGKLQPQTQIVEDDELEEDEQEMNDEPELKSEPSFIGKIFGGGKKKQQDEAQQLLLQEQQQDIENMKETIKILHRWLEKLPPERIAEFKRSPDFEKYKEGLKKLGLIKE